MPAKDVTCEQAIFTSVRSPMGEGYRIIAASRGVKPEEKQAITRFSPSHEGLCAPEQPVPDAAPMARAAAFYSLPTGRLCAAWSCFAGAEHTGRGGQRVYTHNIIFDTQTFAACGFNPFLLFRAMCAAGIDQPQLKPPPVLESIKLSADAECSGDRARLHESLGSGARGRVLSGILSGSRVVLNVTADWLETTEALLLGIPGPARARCSFAAGMKYSAGRTHLLHVLRDEHHAARTRTTGQSVEFVDAASCTAASPKTSAWVAFVERHWAAGSLALLARRTNQAFPDTTPPALERIARLYDTIDNLNDRPTESLLSEALEQMRRESTGVEGEVVAELLAAEASQLRERFARGTWSEARRALPALASIRQAGARGHDFARPLVIATVRCARGAELLEACEAAIEALRAERAQGGDESDERACLDDVTLSLARHLEQEAPADAGRVQKLCVTIRRWHAQCPALARLEALIAPAGAAGRP